MHWETMRVLMLSWEYPPYMIGGLGKHIADLAPALCDEDITIFVITPHLRGGEARQTIARRLHIVRIPPPPDMELQNIPLNAPPPAFVLHYNHELERAARHLALEVGGFDLIHTHDWLTATTAIALKQCWHIPLIATIHATEYGRCRGNINGQHSHEIDGIEWRLTYEAWRVIVCSHFMQTQLMEHFHTPPDKIDIIPNGVYLHPNPFNTPYDRLVFRRKFAADDEQLGFSIGRIVYEKGLHVLIDAWSYVLHHFNARLIIAGSGPYADTLRAQIERLGLQAHIFMAGFISNADRRRLYYAANVAIVPSLYEPFGIVSLEAAAAGCPVVVTETGGLKEVVRVHETGIIVTPDHIESLAWGILHTLQHPRWSRARALNALADIRENYNWHKIARQTRATYQRVLAAWQTSDWGAPLSQG